MNKSAMLLSISSLLLEWMIQPQLNHPMTCFTKNLLLLLSFFCDQLIGKCDPCRICGPELGWRFPHSVKILGNNKTPTTHTPTPKKSLTRQKTHMQQQQQQITYTYGYNPWP